MLPRIVLPKRSVAARFTKASDGGPVALPSVFYSYSDLALPASTTTPAPSSGSMGESRTTKSVVRPAMPFSGPDLPSRVNAVPAPAFATFGDVMAFSGTAPERVNGRLAMLGFVTALAAELYSGDDVLQQMSLEPTGINLVFLIIMAGSLVPLFKSKTSEMVGPFTPSAEMMNGRAAMLGFASLLVIEAVKGTALF